MDKAGQIVKKYRSSLRSGYFVVLGTYLVACLILSLLNLLPLTLLVLVFLMVIAGKLNAIMSRKYITSILIDDLDAPLYREVVYVDKMCEKNIFLGMESEFYVGNISSAIAIGEALLRVDGLSTKQTRFALAFLAQYYFCIGDDEALAGACKRFRELKMPKIRTKRMRRMIRSIEKYEMYLAGDFNGFLRPSGIKQKGTFYSLANSYFEARVALAKGDLLAARTIFSSLSVSADNTVFAILSKRAVGAIDSGIGYRESVLQMSCEPIDAEVMVGSYMESAKKSKKGMRIMCLIWAVILIFALPNSIRDWIYYVDEKITLDVLDEHYDNIEIADMFWFNVNGKRNELMFIAENDGDLYLGGRYRDENGDWMASIYSVCRLSELDENGRFLQAFSNHDYSAVLYFHVNSEFFYVEEDDVLLYGRYYVRENYFTVIIDDEVIE